MAVREGNKRYLVFKIDSESSFEPEEVKEEIEGKCLKVVGELGFSESEFKFLKDFYSDNKGVIKVNNKFVPKLKMILGLIEDVGERNVSFEPIKVYGTLKKLKNNMEV